MVTSLGKIPKNWPPLKFHFAARTTSPYSITPFLMLYFGINLIWSHFFSFLLSNWLFAAKFSKCSNSLNFEAKFNCNTTKPNVPKWRKKCTGLKLDLVPFNGPQMQFLSDHNFERPCIYMKSYHLSQQPSSAHNYQNWKKDSFFVHTILRVWWRHDPCWKEN